MNHTPESDPDRLERGRRLSFGRLLRVLPCFLLLAPAPSLTQTHETEDTVAFDRQALFEVFREARAGIMVSPQFREISARFSVKPGTDSCGVYDGGTTNSTTWSFFFDIVPESIPGLWIPFRLSRVDRSVTLQSGERIQPARAPSGELIDVATRNLLEVRADGIKLAIGAGWRVNEVFRIGVAPSVLAQSIDAVRNLETIVRPVEARFPETGGGTRPFRRGQDLSIRTIVPGLDLLASAQITLGPFFAFHPEVRVGFPLSDIVRDVDWRELELEGGIGISFDLASRSFLVDTSRSGSAGTAGRAPALRASITAYGVNAAGERYDNPVIEIEETPWSESVPLIPYIFFDSASAAIPARYRRLPAGDATERFSIDSLLSITPIDIHWQMLNVLGRRMRQSPGSTLSIVGTVAGDEAGSSALALGRARADAVAAYLHEVWGISSDRISTAATLRSATASPEDTPEGRGENRRVDLHTLDPELLAPVLVSRTASVASPPSVRFAPVIIADTSIAEWYISIVQADRELLRFTGDTTMASLRQQKEWSLADLRVRADLTPIRYRLTVRDVTGQSVIAEGAFRVVERVRTRQVDTAGTAFEVVEQILVGFGYNSPNLLAEHIAQISELSGSLPPVAAVTVSGYTDRVGDAGRNQILSRLRAQNTAEQLRLSRARRALPPLAFPCVDGLGSSRELFDNDLPEGRLLSRMVRITVVVPTAQDSKR